LSKEKYTVDLWKTGLHGAEVGIKRTEELVSKSRHFTKDSDIIGEVRKDKDKIGYIVYREGLWKKQPPFNRLVIRYFTESFGWKGSLDQLTGVSVAHTISAENPMPAFIVNVAKHGGLCRLEKVARTRSVAKRVYAMLIPPDEEAESGVLSGSYYTIDEARLSLGTDWNVKDVKGDRVASIDGKIIDVGGEWKIDMKKEAPSDLVISFCCGNENGLKRTGASAFL